MFTKDGEPLVDLGASLLASLEQVGVDELGLVLSGDELNDENANMGEEEAGMRPEILQHSLVLCDESIGKFGVDSNQLLRKNNQKSLTKDHFFEAMGILRDEFGVSLLRGSDAVVKDGETLADLRNALLRSIDQSNVQSAIILEPQATHGGNLELLKGALGWCEASIIKNGGDSDLLLSQSQWPEGRKFAPILKFRYGVETVARGFRQGTHTQAGTTLTDLRKELLADIVNPDRPMS